MRVLTFTNLYPSSAQPRHGIFVEHRLRRLIATGGASASVVSPVPWFPLRRGPFSRFRISAQVPATDERYGIRIWHPRFPVVPGFSAWINPVSMASSALPAVLRARREHGDFDLIDAQFVYPDGIAGLLIGRWLGKPVVITARGSDVNAGARSRVARAWIRWAAARCSGFVAVSTALSVALVEIGVPRQRVTVVRNGVDLELFRRRDRELVRARLGISGPAWLCVGNLVREKGHEIVIEALAGLKNERLIVIGSGPLAADLQKLAQSRGVAERITWIAHVPQESLPAYYAAADVTVLASSREGMPNVLLESLACGTPVIASAVGGIPEIVGSPEAGGLMDHRSPRSLLDAYRRLREAPPAAEAVRAYAEKFGWDEPVMRQLRLFESVVA